MNKIQKILGLIGVLSMSTPMVAGDFRSPLCIVIIKQAYVVSEIAADCALVATVKVPFEAGTVRVHVSAHVRGPGSEVDPAGVRIVEPGLHGGQLVGLRNATEPVIADQRGIASVSVCWRRGGSGRLRGRDGRKRKQAGDGGSEHQLFHGRTFPG